MIVFINIKTKKINIKIKTLELRLGTSNKKISILHNMIQDILTLFNPEIQEKFKNKYNMQKDIGHDINDYKPTQVSNVKNNNEPVKKRQSNPLESIMNMVGPMMSSMMVSGYKNDVPSQSKPIIIEEEEDDEDEDEIENELKELQKMEVKSGVEVVENKSVEEVVVEEVVVEEVVVEEVAVEEVAVEEVVVEDIIEDDVKPEIKKSPLIEEIST
jgi:hypothetical protein